MKKCRGEGYVSNGTSTRTSKLLAEHYSLFEHQDGHGYRGKNTE